MVRNWRTASAVGCLVGMLTAFVPSMAQQPATNARPANAAPSAGGTPAQPVAARQAGDQAQEEVDIGQIELNGNHTVNLDREGNVNGKISLLDPRTGRPTPVENAVVSFVQGGRLVTQVRPASDGSFTVRLSPGVYSVIAQAPAGFGAFAVVVKPYDPTASDPQELSLDGTLIPNADIQAANAPGLGGPLGPPPGIGPGGTIGGGGGFVGGGAGGGGSQGGLGGLLGLAPLAALGALGSGDDGGASLLAPPASPAAP